jgi:hypothetical protein
MRACDINGVVEEQSNYMSPAGFTINISPSLKDTTVLALVRALQ